MYPLSLLFKNTFLSPLDFRVDEGQLWRVQLSSWYGVKYTIFKNKITANQFYFSPALNDYHDKSLLFLGLQVAKYRRITRVQIRGTVGTISQQHNSDAKKSIEINNNY